MKKLFSKENQPDIVFQQDNTSTHTAKLSKCSLCPNPSGLGFGLVRVYIQTFSFTLNTSQPMDVFQVLIKCLKSSTLMVLSLKSCLQVYPQDLHLYRKKNIILSYCICLILDCFLTNVWVLTPIKACHFKLDPLF